MGRLLGAIASLIVAAGAFAAPVSADIPGYPDIPGCRSDILFGLNPQYRTVCDQDIQADGSWTRFRQLWFKPYPRKTCGDKFSDDDCPTWARGEVVVPEERDPVETYVVTTDTVPLGEPGHLG